MGLLDGRRALVTGGASGIGLATVRRFAAEGARVVVVDRDETAGRAAADEVDGRFLPCDVVESSQVEEAFAKAESLLGGVDVAYLNAGVVTPESDVTKITDEQYRRTVGIDVDGVFFGVREAARCMQRTGGGSILCTASLAGLVAYPGDPVYALSKHAVVGLVRALGPQLAGKGITINAICPGIVATPLVGEANIDALEQAGFPLLRAEDIAEACVKAVTSGLTGQCWPCQPGREAEPYQFRGVPGPRVPGKEGMAPPIFR